MKFAYADPPYLGCGALYAKHHPDALLWDDPETHRGLIERLCAEYPDGWAMSLSTPSLRVLLPMCPDDCRVLSWVKPFGVFKPNVGVAYVWEPVIVRGGRRRTRQQRTVRDWLAEGIALKKGLTGAKPPAFAHWLLDVLNVQKGDQVDDLFPGTGVVSRCAEVRTSGRPTLDDLPLGNQSAAPGLTRDSFAKIAPRPAEIRHSVAPAPGANGRGQARRPGPFLLPGRSSSAVVRVGLSHPVPDLVERPIELGSKDKNRAADC